MGRPKLMRDEKPCGRCRNVLPLAVFRFRNGEGTEGPYCPDCRRKRHRDYVADYRRALGKPTRPPRINARGDVWCFDCKRYLPPASFKWVDFPSLSKPRWWSYCMACQQARDRARWTGDRQARHNASRSIRQRRDHHVIKAERSAVVRGAIATLRRRGLTRAEIVRLAQTSWSSLQKWERGQFVPTSAIVSRFLVLLVETSSLPMADEPCPYRRLPHPDFHRLMARCRPKVAAFPVRDTWLYRRAA